MTLSIKNLKKKLVETYEETVKKATTTAMPIIKKEAAKAIARTTEEKIDVAFKILTMMGVAIFAINGRGSVIAEASKAPTYIHIENLTINL